MTLPALRLILADVACVLPETILPESRLDRIGPPGYERTTRWNFWNALYSKFGGFPWHIAEGWVIVQDVLDYLEAREEKPFGDPPDRA
jgi:hypothetical protein